MLSLIFQVIITMQKNQVSLLTILHLWHAPQEYPNYFRFIPHFILLILTNKIIMYEQSFFEITKFLAYALKQVFIAHASI